MPSSSLLSLQVLEGPQALSWVMKESRIRARLGTTAHF